MTYQRLCIPTPADGPLSQNFTTAHAVTRKAGHARATAKSVGSPSTEMSAATPRATRTPAISAMTLDTTPQATVST